MSATERSGRLQVRSALRLVSPTHTQRAVAHTRQLPSPLDRALAVTRLPRSHSDLPSARCSLYSAHTAEELRRSLSVVAYAPVLCSVKGCSDPQCAFAHNMAESQYHPDVYKTKLCSHFDKPSGCPVSHTHSRLMQAHEASC